MIVLTKSVKWRLSKSNPGSYLQIFLHLLDKTLVLTTFFVGRFRRTWTSKAYGKSLNQSTSSPDLLSEDSGEHDRLVRTRLSFRLRPFSPDLVRTKRSCSPEFSDKRSGDEVDWVRDLLESLLFHVLLNLPTKDMVKTSVVSPEWRHLWRYVPGLDLDCRDFTEFNDVCWCENPQLQICGCNSRF